MNCGESAQPLESVKSDRSAVSTAKDNYEHLKDGASEGFPLSFLSKCFQNPMACVRSFIGDLGLGV